MQSFKEYALSEYSGVSGITSTLFKFSHSMKIKIDKKSSKTFNEHTINVTIQMYDKDMNELKRASLKFINNTVPTKMKFINISPKELENRFNAAKKEIVNEIFSELNDKMEDISQKINMLKLYSGGSVNTIIPSEFEGELIQSDEKKVSKNKFEM